MTSNGHCIFYIPKMKVHHLHPEILLEVIAFLKLNIPFEIVCSWNLFAQLPRDNHATQNCRTMFSIPQKTTIIIQYPTVFTFDTI
jgi:hypothetical protein